MKLSLFDLELAGYGVAILAGLWLLFRLLDWVGDSVKAAAAAAKAGLGDDDDQGWPFKLHLVLPEEEAAFLEKHADATPYEELRQMIRDDPDLKRSALKTDLAVRREMAKSPGRKAFVTDVSIPAASPPPHRQ